MRRGSTRVGRVLAGAAACSRRPRAFSSRVALSEGATTAHRHHAARPLHTTSVALKTIPFNLPDIGEGIAEVEVLKWFVKPGDRISQFDKLLEVQSDKATVEITSRYDGVVAKVRYAVGEMAPTGQALLDIELDDDGTAAGEGAAGDAATPGGSTAGSGSAEIDGASGAAGAGGMRTFATPAVRRIAREHGLSLAQISGTGRDGRVTKDDIQRFVAGRAAASAAPPAAAAAAPPLLRPEVSPRPAAVLPPPPAAAPEPFCPTAAMPPAPSPGPAAAAAAAGDVTVPVRGLQRAMVKSMTAAWAAPHFGFSDEVVVDELMRARAALLSAAKAHGVKLSYLPLLLKALSLALRDYPSLNATVGAGAAEVVQRGAHNLGVAMDSPRGLIVPNVKGVQSLSVFGIARELARLQAAASAGQLSEADLSGGTFTLSNIGNIGGTYLSPVLFTPQVAIGAIGRISKQPRYLSTLPPAIQGHHLAAAGGSGASDPVVPAHILTVSWVGDHRVVDGATLARFSNAWRGYLEAPLTMLAELR